LGIGNLLLINLILLNLVNLLLFLIREVQALKGEGRKLGGLLEESLLESDSYTELVVDEPNLVEVDDGTRLLTLLDRIERDHLLVHVVALGNERPVRLGENLELHGSWILLLAGTDDGLVEGLLENRHIEILAEPLLRVGGDGVDDDIVELLELVVESHSLFVVGIEREVERVRSASRSLVGVRTQTIRRAKEGELNVELFVVTRVEVDGLAAILVLAKLRKLHGGRRELGRLLDSERHCWLVISMLGGSTLSKFFC